MAIRTTLIVGYPGETQEDFNILKDFVQEMKFDEWVVLPILTKKIHMPTYWMMFLTP
jgi:tRNA A37 methylthiotransferase MiaB